MQTLRACVCEPEADTRCIDQLYNSYHQRNGKGSETWETLMSGTIVKSPPC